MTSPEQNGTQDHLTFEISVRYLLFGQPLLLILLPAALLLLPHATPLLPPPLQLLQLLLGLSLAVPQLLQLLALFLLEALSDLLQALLRLQDGLRLLRLRGPAAQRRKTTSGSGFLGHRLGLEVVILLTGSTLTRYTTHLEKRLVLMFLYDVTSSRVVSPLVLGSW